MISSYGSVTNYQKIVCIKCFNDNMQRPLEYSYKQHTLLSLKFAESKHLCVCVCSSNILGLWSMKSVLPK